VWNISFGALFHVGNVVLGAGFVIPQSYTYSLISYRGGIRQIVNNIDEIPDKILTKSRGRK
jgi:hypothetical protein